MRVIRQIDDELAQNGAQQLRDDVRQHFAPREQAVDSLSEGHCRIDVCAGNAAEHHYREHHTKAIAHGDVQPSSVMTLGVLQLDVSHGAIAENHQDGSAEKLSCQLGKEGKFHCFFFSLRRTADMTAHGLLYDWNPFAEPATLIQLATEATCDCTLCPLTKPCQCCR